jgi:hypothetical protein
LRLEIESFKIICGDRFHTISIDKHISRDQFNIVVRRAIFRSYQSVFWEWFELGYPLDVGEPYSRHALVFFEDDQAKERQPRRTAITYHIN